MSMEYMPWKATEWFGHRLLVPFADRLPDKITVPVSAKQRCQNRANYRCKSHP